MVGKNLIVLQEVDSTNNYARGLIQSKAAGEGTAVLAYSQKKGKGQENNVWESQPGKNLTVSFIFQPLFLRSDKQFYLSMVAALSAGEFAGKYATDVKIKWPNDIYWQNKKVGGILIENLFLGNTFEFSIFGFGLNINQVQFYSDAPNPISLKMITGLELNIENCFRTLSNCLDFWYNLLKDGSTDKIRANYLENLYLRDLWTGFRSHNREFTGKIVAVEESGKLIVMGENGSLYSFNNKEIEFIL